MENPKCSVCGKVMRAYVYNSLLDSGYSPKLPPKKEYRFDCDNGCSTTNWKIMNEDQIGKQTIIKA